MALTGLAQSINNVANTVMSYQDWLNQSAVSYLVRPYTAQGIGGFVFSIRAEEQLELRSEITDYVTESNKDIQSHISLKPIRITLRGYIGEVVNDVTPALSNIGGQVQSRLTAVSQFLPLFDASALLSQRSAIQSSQTTAIDVINNYAKAAENLVSAFGVTLPGQTKQEQAFASLFSMWQSRQVFTVDTPWAYFDNMVIESLVPMQDEKTESWSDFTVTLKRMTFSSTVTRAATSAERRALQELGFLPAINSQGSDITPNTKPWTGMLNQSQSAALNATLGE